MLVAVGVFSGNEFTNNTREIDRGLRLMGGDGEGGKYVQKGSSSK